MVHRSAREGSHVLICAPFGNDAKSVGALLTEQGYKCEICQDIGALAAAMNDDTGVAMVTEEAMRGDLAALQAALERQPPWSDVPFILLISRPMGRTQPLELSQKLVPRLTGNIIALERPLSSRSLYSAIDSALVSRQKQFEMRDRLKELGDTAAALRESQAGLEAKVVERTEALNAEMAARLQTEETLRQSQKMEAIGQLTGGIAHDFNNMLTGVIGSIEIMQKRISEGRIDDLGRFMDAALISARRAAGLTQRLLAFSRRQSLDPKPVDVQEMLHSLEDLFHRTLGERVDVTVTLGPNLPHALADANQLESAILNLVVNARDAMPEGGKLTVEASVAELDADYCARHPEIQRGRYVVIAVSDTGVGMPPEVLEKVFDPFFTTKPIGQGTGLGLSMVYGFAQQSRGQVRIHSQPDQGTSVKLYLPATNVEIDAPAPTARNLPSGTGQAILVVEDDASVRLLVTELLRELGYSAIEAADAEPAIDILRSKRDLQLMISDVGLPGMNGRQLAEIARAYRPDLPILFVTGYAENAAIRADFLGANMAMITKPFALDSLSAKIGEMVG